MREIGVRELKATLSDTLRAVGRGEQVRVTVRGRPIAELVPPGNSEGDAGVLHRLVAQGRLAQPTQPLPRHAPELARGARSASELVLADRDAER